MNSTMPNNPQFTKYYRKHQKCLKLNGLQPKPVEAYSRALRRVGNYFNCRIDDLSQGHGVKSLFLTKGKNVKDKDLTPRFSLFRVCP